MKFFLHFCRSESNLSLTKSKSRGSRFKSFLQPLRAGLFCLSQILELSWRSLLMDLLLSESQNHSVFQSLSDSTSLCVIPLRSSVVSPGSPLHSRTLPVCCLGSLGRGFKDLFLLQIKFKASLCCLVKTCFKVTGEKRTGDTVQW